MSEPKFKRGQTVLILPRNLEGNMSWENTNVGGYAIIESFFDKTAPMDYEDTHLYSLWLLFDDGTPSRSCHWFEEKYLQIECSNEQRGIKILDEVADKRKKR